MLESAGFPLFGMAGSPTADISPQVRVIAGTMWSNQRADDMLWLHKPKQADQFLKTGAVNILYPHWGYELEAFPRKFITRLGRQFAHHYDAVIGHHAHNPQPMEVVNGVPIAYGLGDFCYHYNLPTYRHGMIVRMEIGQPTTASPPRISSVAWDPVVNQHDDERITVEIADRPRKWL